MIIVVHNQQKLVKLIIDNIEITTFNGEGVTYVIPKLIAKYPYQLLIWCHETVANNVSWASLNTLFDSDRKMLSYLPDINFFPDSLGFIEDSIYIKVNKKVTFPTWQMSSYVGGVSIRILAQIDSSVWKINNFDYVLNSIAKTYQSEGLFCYSEPKLLVNTEEFHSCEKFQANLSTLFHFVKEHYKSIWCFILFFNLLIYKRKIAFWGLLKTHFLTKKHLLNELIFNPIESSAIDISSQTIDVIIPTIGRKQYLYDVLKDLSVQTHLPKNVIIVEQNPIEKTKSELDFVYDEKWPFSIKHFFIHQPGACNARNLALAQVSSEWVFLNDDDNRFSPNLIEKVLQFGIASKSTVLTTCYLQPHEKQKVNKIIQWPTFGAGNSFLKSFLLKDIKFNMSYEFGYAEDGDLGMQIRNKGYDIIYLPEPNIIHLKAPMGGFRTKPKLDWHDEPIAPKPSPTVMLFALLYKTNQQLLGYKTTLFFKYYRLQSIKNPFTYFKMFQKQWKVSLKWANLLKNKYEL